MKHRTEYIHMYLGYHFITLLLLSIGPFRRERKCLKQIFIRRAHR